MKNKVIILLTVMSMIFVVTGCGQSTKTMGRMIKAYMPDEMKVGESVYTSGVTSFGNSFMKITKVREKRAVTSDSY